MSEKQADARPTDAHDASAHVALASPLCPVSSPVSPMEVNDVLECAFGGWYPKFIKCTFKSQVLPLPADVVSYLLADGGLVLPEGSTLLSHDHCQQEAEDSDDVDWEAAAKATPTMQGPSFPEFDKAVKTAIAELGGAVFVKLNWSAPKDASWIGLNNSLKCTTPADIYLLLKSSDFVTHDLTQPFKNCNDASTPPEVKYHLVLRQWRDVNPSTEFRCFVFDRNIIGVCQRDGNNCYAHIKQEFKDIVRDIQSFYKEKIKRYFPLRNYTFDVVRSEKDVVKLVDFNPFGATTDPILFSWEELNQMALKSHPDCEAVFRQVTTDLGVQPSPYRYFQVPTDVLDVCSGSDLAKLTDLLKLRIQSEKEDSDSEDEENCPT